MENKAQLLCFLFLLFGGCSSISPPPLKSLPSFLEHREQMAEKRSIAPFLLMWFADEKDFSTQKKLYSSIELLPVETKFIQKSSNDDPSDDDIKEIADYAYKTFSKTFDKMISTGTTGSGVLYLQLALVKLVPTNSAVDIAENVAGVFIPGSILVTSAVSAAGSAAAHEVGKGEIAIAVKIKRGEKKQDFLEVYDEREDRNALIINIEDFSRLGNSKTNLEEWAKEFHSLLYDSGSKPVDGPSAIALALW